jgi:hypothetical protein
MLNDLLFLFLTKFYQQNGTEKYSETQLGICVVDEKICMKSFWSVQHKHASLSERQSITSG